MGATWVNGEHHKISEVKMPKATYGSCKNFKRCGNTEAVLRQRNEMLGNGYCMQCYDKDMDIRRPRLTKQALAERKETVIEMLNKEVPYKEIAREVNMAPSSMWIYIKRLEEKGEIVLKKPLVKEKPTYGRIPDKRKKREKGAIGDRVLIDSRNKSYGKFSNEHSGHEALIVQAKDRIADRGFAVKFMYLLQCEECKDSEPSWVYRRSFIEITGKILPFAEVSK